MTAIVNPASAREEVLKRFPDACAVRTLAGFSDKYHYRIWPTSDWFETRVVGKGDTEDEAWIDAMRKIQKSDSKKDEPR